MKLYLFDPNTWGMRYFVAAENEVAAHKSLLVYFKLKIKDPEEYYSDEYKQKLKKWKKVNPLDASTFPRNYTLKEFEGGTVVESELA